jgi:hypothetical protein
VEFSSKEVIYFVDLFLSNCMNLQDYERYEGALVAARKRKKDAKRPRLSGSYTGPGPNFNRASSQGSHQLRGGSLGSSLVPEYHFTGRAASQPTRGRGGGFGRGSRYPGLGSPNRQVGGGGRGPQGQGGVGARGNFINPNLTN